MRTAAGSGSTKSGGAMKPTQSIGAAMKTAASVRALTPTVTKNGGAVAQGKAATQKTPTSSSRPQQTWEQRAEAARAQRLADAREVERQRRLASSREELKKRLKELMETGVKAAQGTVKNADDLTR